MTPDRFRELLDAYGAEPARWPENEREAALAFANADASAGAMLDETKRLDALIAGMQIKPPVIDTARIVAAATRLAQEPDTSNVVAFAAKRRVARPVMMWARGAALAAATVCGFVIGMSDQGALSDSSALDLLDQVQTEDIAW